MKSLKLLFLLSFMFVISSAFKQEDGVRSLFTATVDGKSFQSQDDQLLRGLLMNKNASMDGKIPARTVISAMFNGQSYNITEEKIFTESVQFEIGYEDGKTGQPSYYALAMQYQSGKYYLLKEQSKMNITEFKWEDDKKHFRISADYDCKMRSWGYPSDKVKDVSLKGKMTNIRITVPSWLVTKN